MTPPASFVPQFVADYNQRRREDDLERIFTWQEERTMSRNLVVH
jgi:hypothetical protein